MTEQAGHYAGLDRYECRRNVVEDLESAGLPRRYGALHAHIGQCYRCKTVIEPVVSKQWFVKIAPLAGGDHRGGQGKTRIIPIPWEATYFEWMNNIRDWCISRQIWWGHRIPVWYCDDCGEVIVAARGSRQLPALRLAKPPAGRGRAGHLVQLGALAVFDPGLAGQDRRR